MANKWNQQQWSQKQSTPAKPAWPQPSNAAKAGGNAWQNRGPAGTAKPAGAPPSSAVGPPSALVVSTGGKDMDEIVIRTLVGEFRQHGENHGRKTYKKVQSKPGQEAVSVFIYYWDSRDGDAFEGWWFGNELGGTQVWSHIKASGLTPPVTGWKIPWDGAVRSSMTVKPLGAGVAGVKKEPQAQFGSAKPGPASPPTHLVPSAARGGGGGMDPQLQAAAEELRQTNATAEVAMEQAAIMASDQSGEAMNQAVDLLAPQDGALAGAIKQLLEFQKQCQGKPEALREFSQIGQKLRATKNSLAAEVGKLRMAKLKVEKEEKLRNLEEKDMVVFQEVMPEAIEKTNMAEDAVEKAAITAEMIDSGEDMEEIRGAVDETEKAAKDAQTAIGEARIYLNAKLASVKRFESESVRKNATEELAKLQQQLAAAQQKLTPLKTVRQDFIQRTAAKKLIAELKEKLSPAEVDVDKAEVASQQLAEDGANKDILKQAEEAHAKANEHINSVLKTIEAKKKSISGQGVIRTELEKVEKRVQDSLTKLQAMKTEQKAAIERISCSSLTQEASEKLQAVQDAIANVAEAETPFLTGLEELPLEETLKAVKACEVASTTANTSVSIARMFIATKLVEVKRFTTAPSKEAQTQLAEHQKQLESLTQRLTELKKGMAKRKKEALMRESEGCVTKAEELAQKVAEAASVFEDDEKLAEASSDDLKKASEDTSKAMAEANSALAEARKFITARQIEAKGKDSSESVTAVLVTYQTRLGNAQGEVSKYKKLSATVDQRLAAKKSAEEAKAKVVGVEEKVKKACDLAAEFNDMTPESIGEKGYQEAQKAAEAAATTAGTALKQIDRYLASQARLTGPAKEEIGKLSPRVQEAQKQLEESQAAMRERSEKVLVDGIISESDKRVSEAEDAISKAEEAEKPFATEDELGDEETLAAINALESAAGAAHSSVGGAKTFLAMKRLAAKRLAENVAKITTEELSKCQTRLDDVTTRLQKVRKGMADRKAGQTKKLIAAKVTVVEKKVAEATEATKSLETVEASPEFSAEKAKSECEKLSGLEKEAQKMMDEALTFLVEKQRDVKGSEEETKALQTRLTTAQSELAKSKKALSEFEQRFVSQQLLSSANTIISDLEAEIEKVRTAAAPLIEEGGIFFLAGDSVALMSEAFSAHIKKTESTKEALFELAGGTKDGKISKDSFLEFVDKLPEKVGNEDLVFPEDQRPHIFAHVDADGDGEINMADLSSIFSSKYTCVQGIAITDGLDIAKSKTVQKLELEDVVEVLGAPHVTEGSGVTRVECKAVKSGNQGWVTMKGNQGTVYLEAISPFNSFIKTTDKSIEAVAKSSSKASSFVKNKSAALANSPKGPLSEARAELQKLKPKILAAQKEIEKLKQKMLDSKQEYAKKQEYALEAKDRRVAAMLLKDVKEKVEAMDANAAKLQEITKVLISPSTPDLSDVATPMSISSEAEAVVADLAKDCSAVRDACAVQKEAVAKAPKGPMREARQDLAKFMVKADATERKGNGIAEQMRKALSGIAKKRWSQVSAGLRADMQKRGLRIDAFFAELAAGKERISEDAFSACVKKLEGLDLPDEHLKLMMKQIDAEGIPRRSFDQMVQQFYMCVKGIAITNEFKIAKSKTVRMMELNEVVEVLEGPTADAKLTIERVKGRALSDGAEGWISMKGNQGTPFLQETQKPCYYCVSDVPLDKEFRNANGDPPLKTLKTNEVLEVIEGPRKDCFKGAMRAKAKVCKDGATGWFAIKTKEGTENAEQKGKYYVCTAAIAMTDTVDIKNCKVIRKLEPKEFAEVLEGPVEQGTEGVSRVRCKALKDGQEGWITVKGNKGSLYAEETKKLYTIIAEVPLHKAFGTDGAVLVRQLEKDEVIEVVEGPKEEQFEVTRLKGRAVSDASEGWVSVRAATVKRWTPDWKCAAATELTPALQPGGEAVRQLEAGETLEILDGPREEGGVMRAKVRAEKDKVIGWATMKSSEGTSFLEHRPKAPSKEKGK